MNKIIVTTVFLLIGSVHIVCSKPQRIISLSPTATEMLYSIDAGKDVIAVDSYSTYPAHAPKTKLSALEPSLEAIVQYSPDLVITSFDVGNLVAGLTAAGITVLLLPAAKTFKDALDQILELGRVTKKQKNAEALIFDLKQDFKKLIFLRKEKPKLRVYHELDKNFYSPSSSSFLGDIYNKLGFNNIADEADASNIGYPQLSAEYILHKNPQLIVTGSRVRGIEKEISNRPGWQKIDAVKYNAIIKIEPDVSGRWGPRIVDFAREVVLISLEPRYE